MRAAKSRVSVLESAGDVRRAVQGCVRALPVSPRVLRLGATAAAGTVGAGMLVRMLRPRRKGAGPAAPMGFAHILVSEILAGLLLPLCRSYLQRGYGASRRDSQAPGGFFARLFRGH